MRFEKGVVCGLAAEVEAASTDAFNQNLSEAFKKFCGTEVTITDHSEVVDSHSMSLGLLLFR